MQQANKKQVLLAANHLDLLRSLLRHHVPDAEVWAFGSRVNGGAHEGSDLDLVVRNPVAVSQAVTGLAELKDALSESSLPMLIDVLDWAHLPADFHRNILQGYVIVQSATGSAAILSDPVGMSD